MRESILLHRGDAHDSAAAERALATDHLRLGRALLEGTPPEALSARVFSIVQHLNAGRGLIETRAERQRVAELNLVASREAHLTTAYDRAREHAAIGLGLLGDSGWSDAYATTRDLFGERMRAESLSGDSTAASASFDAARALITSAADRTDLHVAWIDLEVNRGNFERAIAVGRERLRELRMAPPSRITTFTLAVQYFATRRQQAGRPIDDLASLEVSRDVTRDSAMKILMTLAPAAFWVDTNLVGWISLKLAELSMRYGVSDASSFGFAGYGVVLAGAFGKYTEAAAFGRVPLALDARFRNAGLEARLLHLNGEFLSGWVRPFAEAKALLEASYERALKQGETAYEAFAACSLSHVSLIESADLRAGEETSRWAREVCVRRRDWNMAGSVEAHARYFATLRGALPLRIDLGRGGEIDAEFVALAGAPAKSPGAYYAFWSCAAWLAYLFGDAPHAEVLLGEARSFAQANFGNPGTVDFCFLEVLVASRAHDRASSWTRRWRLRKVVARRLPKLEAWAKGCPANFEPHFLLARAELARIDGEGEKATACFERAVASARDTGLREGVALELASAFAAQRRDGDSSAAARLRAEADDAYRRCGATALAIRPRP